MRTALIATCLLASVAGASGRSIEETTPFTTCESTRSFPSSRTEMQCRTVRIDAERCRQFRRVNYIGWPYEGDALRKAQATGEKSLDAFDRQWLGAHLGRRNACEKLLIRIGD
jgi:hypothetical protein